ncbi:MAG TPA: hypothetical protein VK535_07925 [Gemmatimonadales bacterium]|nr:hypothetical protein [Gemmatimonadales bacterium]
MRVRSDSWCLPLLLVAAACSSEGPIGSTPSLTVTGSAGAPPALFSNASFVTSGDPSAVRMGMYALWISSNGDCSAPTLVQDYGDAGEVKDLVQNPVLFSAEAAAATYECVIIRMSDVVGFESASSFGTCEANVAYEQDIYREGQTDWKDADLNPIIGTGTDSVPSNDHVALVMTTDTTAAIARGFSSNQVIALASPLVVPGQSTFYWNGQGSVTSEPGYPCGLQPGAPAFE